MDWQKIEIEYITDPAASYRSLAEKYKIPLSTLEKKARREKMGREKKEDRRQNRRKSGEGSRKQA